MRNSALGYFGLFYVSSDCTVNLRTSEFGLVTKLNCENRVRDRRYLHNTQVYLDALM